MKYKIDNEELSAICRYQSAQATGSEYVTDELTDSRAKALDYYYGRPRGDEVDGNSQVQSMDVADSVDAILSQILPGLSSSDLVQFEPLNEQDEEQARIESKFCNWVVMDKCNGFIMLETLIKDVLLSKNCVAKVSVDIKEDVDRERFVGLSQDEMYAALMPTKPNQLVECTNLSNTELIKALSKEKTNKKQKLNIKRTTTTRKLVVEAIPPEYFAISSDHRSVYLDDCKYCREMYWSTRSDMIEQGYDRKLIEDLPSANSETKIDSISRNGLNNEQNHNEQRLVCRSWRLKSIIYA